MIDPNEWFAMMRTAQHRNEDPILTAIKQLPDFDDVIYDDLLTTHYTAVEAADIAAEEAYIAAFNATYDQKHRDIYTVVEYTPERPRRTISVCVNPHRWYALMNETEYRNQVAIRKALGRLDSQKDCDEHRELLANAHNTAVEAANIVAKEAYIAAFNATYDETHRDTYASWPTPRSLSRPTNTRSRPPIEHRSAG